MKHLAIAALAAPVALALATTFAACAKNELPPKGQLMLVVTSDMAPPLDFDEISVQVDQKGENVLDRTFAFSGSAAVTLPATLGIVVGSDANEPIDIRVKAMLRKKVRVVRAVRTTVPADRVVSLPVPIQWLCDDKLDCGTSEQTCIAGDCKSKDVDSSKLPDYSAGGAFGGGTGALDGQCFDTLSCFSTGAYVEPATDCTVPLAPGETKANFAVRLPSTGPGICGSNACLVPLDEDPLYGWSRDGALARLPSEVCRRKSDQYRVMLTTACATKTLTAPTCGTWSSVGKAPEHTETVVIPDPIVDAGSDADASVPGDGGTCGPEGLLECATSTTPRKCVAGGWELQAACQAPTPACEKGACVSCVENAYTCQDPLNARKCVGGALQAPVTCNGTQVWCAGTGGCLDREWGWWKPDDAPPTTNHVVGKLGTIDTVTDTSSGLVWTKIAPTTTLSWSQANTYCAQLAPQNTWRLPTVAELLSLADYSRIASGFVDPIFENTASQAFWTTTQWTAGAFHWYFTFTNGLSDGSSDGAGLHVLCVR